MLQTFPNGLLVAGISFEVGQQRIEYTSKTSDGGKAANRLKYSHTVATVFGELLKSLQNDLDLFLFQLGVLADLLQTAD